jgi:type IV secretory pathway TraG/TraD family ATPase VirD4
VPKLLTWPGSRIVHDIKGENGTLTSGFRSRPGRALLFDPTNPKVGGLQSSARGEARRMGGARRSEGC